MSVNNHLQIEQTKKWILDVVIGCNFCPFAAKEFKKNSIRYIVQESEDIADCLSGLMKELLKLDAEKEIETTFIILPNGFDNFNEYLHLVNVAEKLLKKEKYEGIYQIASFHPNYCFQGVTNNDAANYTNRSVYPMLHILREETIENVLEKFSDPEGIPEKNIAFAREKGVEYMKKLRDACLL